MSNVEDQSTRLYLSAPIITTAILSAAFVIVVIIFLPLYIRCIFRRRSTIVLFHIADDANYASTVQTNGLDQSTTTSSLPVQTNGLDQSTTTSSLPMFAYQKDIHGKYCVSTECAICLSVIDEGQMVRFLPNCKHLFHVECIDMWLYSHGTCPVCRARVELEVGSSDSGLVSRLGSSLRRMVTRERSERRVQWDGSADLERR